jgi:hypothetical protein
MLLLNATTIVKTSSAALVPASNITEEGLALVYVRINGELAVQPSTGVAGEEFAGFAIARNAPPAHLPNVETGVVPVGGSILLHRLPAAGQILVKVDGEILELTAAGTQPTDEAKADVSGATVRFAAAAAGASYTVQYMYEPTVSEAAFMTGNIPVGGYAANVMDVVAFVEIGDIATNLFDASKDWSTVMHPRLGAGGLLTTDGPGTPLPNVLVKSVPSQSSQGFLVVTAR